MKSSSTTTSVLELSVAPATALPSWSSTWSRATSPGSKTIPGNDRPPGAGGTPTAVGPPNASNAPRKVSSARSTSTNTAPKPRAEAARLTSPGMTNPTDMSFDWSGVNSRSGENVLNWGGYEGLRLPKRGGVLVGLAASALTWKAGAPLNTAPRPAKAVGERLLGAAAASGTPSQLISRRPAPCAPETRPLFAPSAARNASTTGLIDAASGPEAVKK